LKNGRFVGGAVRTYRCYLDTNVFLDYIRKRDESVVDFIHNARTNALDLVTSYFTYLEVLDKEAEDFYIQRELRKKKTFGEIRRSIYNRDLDKDELKNVRDTTAEKMPSRDGRSLDLFTLYFLNDAGWFHAMELMSEINLGSGDAVHVATALESNCDILLTKDRHLIRSAREKMVCMAPAEFMKDLQKTG
jgi:predicted nucleic acid-binding protein